MRKVLLPLTFVLATLCPLAKAGVIYTYTGNAFTVINSPYTTSDMITGYFTLASPLAANLPLTGITPTSFSFSDGQQTLDESNTTVAGFFFATDSLGIPDKWDIDLDAPGSFISSANLAAVEDQGYLGPPDEIADVSGDPGSWSITSVPEPTYVGPILIFLLGSAYATRNRAWHCSPAATQRQRR